VIIALFPELAAAGGVQRAGRLVAGALTVFAGRRGETCILLSLNDPPHTPPFRIGTQQISFRGFGRSKAAFLSSALRAAMRQPSLVIALHPHLATVAAMMKVCAPRTHFIVFAHGIEVWEPLGRVRRWALRQSNLTVAPSTDTARHLATQQGIPAEKIRKLPWSLGPEFDACAETDGHSRLPEGFPRGRVILAVARLETHEAYKGVDHLIEALPALLGDVPELQLAVIGGGSDVPRLTQLAHRSGVAQRVHFLGSLRPEEIGSAYAFCDVFALPSGGEGFGLVFLEAMAHAKPVIGGSQGGTPDIIEDGVTGYLVQHGDVAQLTQRLRQLLTDEALRKEMGSRALGRVRSDFTFDRFSREFAALLEGSGTS
jgi:phosphatidylinositol alpha-1,6-mannosyltransferase